MPHIEDWRSAYKAAMGQSEPRHLKDSKCQAGHGSAGPDHVQVAEAHICEALARTPLIEGPAEAEHQPSDGREPHGND